MIYSVESKINQQVFDIELNQSPRNGVCSIDHFNGSTMDLFQINCSNWFDEDEIKDYKIYLKNTGIISQTMESIISFRLPASIDQIAIYEIVVYIRDGFDGLTEYPLPFITIHRNLSAILNFIQTTDDRITSLINSKNQNTMGQMIISISQLLNQMNDQFIDLAVQSKHFFELFLKLSSGF